MAGWYLAGSVRVKEKGATKGGLEKKVAKRSLVSRGWKTRITSPEVQTINNFFLKNTRKIERTTVNHTHPSVSC